jgi:hypothetical protein
MSIGTEWELSSPSIVYPQAYAQAARRNFVMFAFEFSVLLACSALLALGSLVQTARTALPQIAAPETLEMRFTVREVVVQYKDGKVVPLRPRAVISLPGRFEGRAAA